MTETRDSPPVDGAAGADATEVRSWGWHLLQVSSWVLVVMVPIHLYTTWLLHDPGHVGVAIYVDRWRSGAWRAFDWAFVMLGLLHGGLGLEGLLRDRIGSPRGRMVAVVAESGVLGVLALAVSVAVLRFDAR